MRTAQACPGHSIYLVLLLPMKLVNSLGFNFIPNFKANISLQKFEEEDEVVVWIVFTRVLTMYH